VGVSDTDVDSTDADDPSIEVRQARPEDEAAVAAFTRETWPGREASDYIPRIYREWIAGDGDRQRTFLIERDGEPAGVCQGVLLSGHEAWAQGMRVAPTHRGVGLALGLNDAVAGWARERGASVLRNMVFSWNAESLGVARAAGFAPATEFRWAHPAPDPEPAVDDRAADGDGGTAIDGDAGADLDVVSDPDGAWSYWNRSTARTTLRGLALDAEESWALSELTRERLRRAAEETAVFAVRRSSDGSSRDASGRAAGSGTRGLAYRVRDFEREAETERKDTDGGTERWAEYGVGAWADLDAARALFDAIGADAAAIGADRTRVLIPETPRNVTDAAAARAGLSDDPDFVLEADLTGL
jgi:GNAT superfamily N-acetyltransferase